MIIAIFTVGMCVGCIIGGAGLMIYEFFKENDDE